MNESQIEKILYYYCKDEMKNLAKICDKYIKGYGGISDKDKHDFYSIALDVLNNSVYTYKEGTGAKFSSYLTGNIIKKFKTEMTRRNRNRRIPAGLITSMEKENEEGNDLSEIIASNFDIHKEAFPDEYEQDDKIEKYLSRLSILQKKILKLTVEKYKPNEIKEILHIKDSEYNTNLDAIRAFENIKLLM